MCATLKYKGMYTAYCSFPLLNVAGNRNKKVRGEEREYHKGTLVCDPGLIHASGEVG